MPRPSTRSSLRTSSCAVLASVLLLAGCDGGPSDAVDGGEDGAFTVVSTSPEDGAGDVAAEASIRVTFSAPCEPSTVTAESFTLSLDGALVDAAVSVDGDTATLTPSAPLLDSATYTAAVEASVADVDGRALAAQHTWQFSTAAPGRAPRLSMDALTYAGAFRLRNGMFGVSRLDYAVGTLAFNPENRSLFVVGHAHQSAVAEFPLVEPGMQTEVAELPVTDDPIQPFVDVLSTAGNPESLDRVTGMLWVDGALLINAEQWYDAPGDNEDTTVVIADADDLAGARGGWFELSGAARSAGYMGAIPMPWQEAFGATHYTGWSSVYSIISRYSIGPSLWSFAPGDLIAGDAAASPAVDATPHMSFPFPDRMLDERGTEYAAQGTPGPFPPASPVWNALSRGMYGFFAPGTRTFVVVGSTAGLETGIGYKAVQEDGHTCGGPCPYGVDDRYNYYWLFDVEDLLAAENAHDPRPYDYGVWEVPFAPGASHSIVGATLDAEERVLYVALGGAGQVGDYDRPPLIVTFTLP